MLKPLLVLARITLVGCLWSIIFIEGVRVIVLENWRFDIFWPPHWVYAWNLWQSGWVIDTPKEWAFILILLTFVPLWLTGWIALSLIPWERLIYAVIAFPFKLLRGTVRPIAQAVAPTPVVVKRKSYKEVRPNGRRLPISDYKAPVSTSDSSLSAPVSSLSTTKREMPKSDPLTHTVFNLDDEDDSFDLDIDTFEQSDIFKIDSEKNKKSYDAESRSSLEQPVSHTDRHISADVFDDEDDDLDDYEPMPRRQAEPKRRSMKFDDEPEFSSSNRKRRETEKTSRRERRENSKDRSSARSGGTVGDILSDKGYDVMRNISVRNTLLDYVAVSEDRILIAMIDKESGDWLADEERFNDEEPLWFSENAHRISPVRTIDIARRQFEKVLSGSDFDMDIEPYVIVVSGNIINAEDMFEIWDGFNVKVARFAKGKPTDLPLLTQVIPPTKDKLSNDDLAAFKKLMKKLI